jgi:hypothetical protein
MPDHGQVNRVSCIAGVVLACCVCLGCGPPPPQPPAAQGERVATALAGITQACGLSYQERALPPPPDLGTLEVAASKAAHQLADVYRLNPNWIYQGETLTAVVALAIRGMRECALPGAAAELQREAR